MRNRSRQASGVSGIACNDWNGSFARTRPVLCRLQVVSATCMQRYACTDAMKSWMHFDCGMIGIGGKMPQHDFISRLLTGDP